MPIHDWSRVDPGTYHNFHQDWTVELCRTLNRGTLPGGYFAMTDLRVDGREPDVIALALRDPIGPRSGGLAVAEAPPRAMRVSRAETDNAAYARKANRISVRHRRGQVVAIIEIVSPGNKDSQRAIRAFRDKAVDFLRNGIHLAVVDPFPIGSRDPDGIHRLIWDELVTGLIEPHPADKPLTAVGYDAGDELTAYFTPLAVGDSLPDVPLFLADGLYVPLPLEATYRVSWDLTPEHIRKLVESPEEVATEE